MGLGLQHSRVDVEILFPMGWPTSSVLVPCQYYEKGCANIYMKHNFKLVSEAKETFHNYVIDCLKFLYIIR